MNQGTRRTILLASGAMIVCALGLVSAAGQAGPAPQPQLSEQVFKNVQVLRGIPVDEFMDTMGMFASSLGYDCASCHSSDIGTDRDAFAVATPSIQKARQMVLMVNAINRANFGGEPRVSCFTCHRGHYRPEIVPSLAIQYGELVDDPSAMAIVPSRSGSADAVFAKYIEALGGAGRLAALTSFVATGTHAGFNTGGNEMPVEIVASAPDRRATTVLMPTGPEVTAYDGTSGWSAEEWRPVPLMAMTGGNLAGLRMDAIVSFPAGIRAAFSQWQVSSATIDDQPVEILQGSNPGQLPVNLYFDETGLLVRQVRWNRTIVGTLPVQVDYADYRDVAGVKMPFRVVLTWTNGQNTIVLSEIRPNAPIDLARFARPAPFVRP